MIYLPDEYNGEQPTQPQPRPIEDLLSAQADALIAGQEFKVGAASADEYALLHLASRLRETLVPVAPSEEFLSRLKKELTGTPALIPANAPALVERWQRLPASYRVAARVGGLTLGAGLALLATRRVLDVFGRLRHHSADADAGLSYNTAS